MKKEQLEKANELEQLISITGKELKALHLLKKKREVKDKKHYNDGQYWLAISEHNDGSGHKAKLNRYYGNAELLDVIITTLEKQLKEFEIMFQEL